MSHAEPGKTRTVTVVASERGSNVRPQADDRRDTRSVCDEPVERVVRRATLASVCIPGHQVPLGAQGVTAEHQRHLMGPTARWAMPTPDRAPLHIRVWQAAESEPLRSVEYSVAEYRRQHGEADYARIWVAVYEDLVTGGVGHDHGGHPVMVHDRYLMAPSPIPREDIPRLNDAEHLTVFSHARDRKIYAVPPHTKVDPLTFDDVAFEAHGQIEPRHGPDQRPAATFQGGRPTASTSRPSIQASPGEPWAIKVDGLAKVFVAPDGVSETNAVSNVSFALAPGEALGIIGEPNAGKTTLLKCLIGDHLATDGAVFLAAHEAGRPNALNLTPRARRELRTSTMSIVYQDPHDGLKLGLSVGANIAEPLTAAGERSFHRIRHCAAALLDRAGVPLGLLDEKVGTLSHPMRQLVQIAKALANTPNILLLDEPTAGLDAAQSSHVVNLLARLQEESSTAIVVASRDRSVIDTLTERVAVMHHGRLIA